MGTLRDVWAGLARGPRRNAQAERESVGVEPYERQGAPWCMSNWCRIVVCGLHACNVLWVRNGPDRKGTCHCICADDLRGQQETGVDVSIDQQSVQEYRG